MNTKWSAAAAVTSQQHEWYDAQCLQQQ